MVATKLGALLAAEEACDMSFYKSAVERYIDKNVAADDLQFAASVPMMVKDQKLQIDELSESSKLAFCLQQKRAAKALGLIK